MTTPANLSFIDGDITKVDQWCNESDDCSIICHQTNCTNTVGHGLSEGMFSAFGFADVYLERFEKHYAIGTKQTTITDYISKRPLKQKRIIPKRTNICVCKEARDKMGTVVFKRSKNIIVANMMAQYYPGKSSGHLSDTKQRRVGAFIKCLKILEKEVSTYTKVTVAFPYNIGCGKGGGNWECYRALLYAFARNVPTTRVLIIKY